MLSNPCTVAASAPARVQHQGAPPRQQGPPSDHALQLVSSRSRLDAHDRERHPTTEPSEATRERIERVIVVHEALDERSQHQSADPHRREEPQLVSTPWSLCPLAPCLLQRQREHRQQHVERHLDTHAPRRSDPAVRPARLVDLRKREVRDDPQLRARERQDRRHHDQRDPVGGHDPQHPPPIGVPCRCGEYTPTGRIEIGVKQEAGDREEHRDTDIKVRLNAPEDRPPSPRRTGRRGTPRPRGPPSLVARPGLAEIEDCPTVALPRPERTLLASGPPSRRATYHPARPDSMPHQRRPAVYDSPLYTG